MKRSVGFLKPISTHWLTIWVSQENLILFGRDFGLANLLTCRNFNFSRCSTPNSWFEKVQWWMEVWISKTKGNSQGIRDACQDTVGKQESFSILSWFDGMRIFIDSLIWEIGWFGHISSGIRAVHGSSERGHWCQGTKPLLLIEGWKRE